MISSPLSVSSKNDSSDHTSLRVINSNYTCPLNSDHADSLTPTAGHAINNYISDYEESITNQVNQVTTSQSDTLVEQPQPSTKTHAMRTRSQNNIFKPKTLFLATKNPISEPIESTSATVEFNKENWKRAMMEELEALEKNNTWELVESPPN